MCTKFKGNLLVSERIRAFIIYGLSSHLGHIPEQALSYNPYKLYIKIAFNGPSGFAEEND